MNMEEESLIVEMQYVVSTSGRIAIIAVEGKQKMCEALAKLVMKPERGQVMFTPKAITRIVEQHILVIKKDDSKKEGWTLADKQMTISLPSLKVEELIDGLFREKRSTVSVELDGGNQLMVVSSIQGYGGENNVETKSASKRKQS